MCQTSHFTLKARHASINKQRPCGFKMLFFFITKKGTKYRQRVDSIIVIYPQKNHSTKNILFPIVSCSRSVLDRHTVERKQEEGPETNGGKDM